jgi:hypothetical protein
MQWTSPKYQPSKHRNSKHTKGRRRFEQQNANWQAVMRREAHKKNGRYQD